VEPLGPVLANPILFTLGGEMSVRKRKPRPRLDELVTPVVPGYVLDAGAEAAHAYVNLCRHGPIKASPETLNALVDMLNIIVEMQQRARTEPFEISLSAWAKAKELPLKRAYRWAKAGMIPGLVRIGKRLSVRNANLSADALLSRVHPK
jgi:hypothetical protein